MIKANLADARDRLTELVASAERGEDVVLEREGRAVVRLVPVEPERTPEALEAERQKRLGWIGALGPIEYAPDWEDNSDIIADSSEA